MARVPADPWQRNYATKQKTRRADPAKIAGGGWGDYSIPTPWNQKGVFQGDLLGANERWDYNPDTGMIGGQPWESPTYTATENVDRSGGQRDFIDIGSYMPDYMSNITGDPEYLDALNDIRLADEAAAAGTAEGINQLAVGFGGDLSSLLQKGLINQATANAAAANEFSTMKELGRALTRGNEGASNRLASMGTLRSGALNVMRSGLQEGYQRQSTQAQNDLLNQVTGMQRALSQGKAERRASLQGVRSSIAGRLFQQAMMQARPGTRARWNPDMGAYEAMDGSGRFYDASGNPAW